MAEHLFVIGPQRTGTTWIYQLLARQVDGLQLNRIEKESYFFAREKKLSAEKSRSKFLSSMSGESEPKIYADVCSTYFGHLDAVKRILKLFPDAKFVFVKRDEATRKKSFAEHRKFNQLASWIIGYNISWALYERQSKYDNFVTEIKTLVPEERLLELNFNDLKESNGKAWAQALDGFLDFHIQIITIGHVNKSRANSSFMKRLFYLGVRLIQATRIHVAVKHLKHWVAR